MNLIVAVDRNWAIGYQNDLLVRISPDLKRFKALTLGHAVLLGRKTLETFPGGRPLPSRPNFILSTDPAYTVEGATVLHSVDEAVTCCPEDAFVIGGASIYNAMLPHCDTAFVTKIDADFPADVWFPNLDENPAWEISEEEPPLTDNGVTFHYVTYKKVKQHVR